MQSVLNKAQAEKSFPFKSNSKRLLRAIILICSAFVLSACNIEVYDNLDQKQANEMLAVLFRQGIPAERVVDNNGKFAVRVDESRFPEAIATLNELGLPRQEFASIGDVFKNDGIVASPVQERAQMIYALSQELSSTISDIDGVLTARVHLVLPENDPLRQRLIPSSASVFIRHVSSAPMNKLVSQVKLLVANGISGLSYDKVSVVLVPVDSPASVTTATTTTPELVSFLGLYIHPDSASRAALIFFSLIGALVIAVAYAAFVMLSQKSRIYSLPPKSQTSTS